MIQSNTIIALKKDQFGQIGGLTEREPQMLKSDMRRLFIDEDLMMSEFGFIGLTD